MFIFFLKEKLSKVQIYVLSPAIKFADIQLVLETPKSSNIRFVTCYWVCGYL